MSPARARWLSVIRQLLRVATLAALVGLVVEIGFPVDAGLRNWIRSGQLAAIGMFLIHRALAFAWSGNRRAHLRTYWIEFALLVLILLDLTLALFFERSALVTSAWFLGVQLCLVAQFVLGLSRLQEWLTRQSVRPGLLLVGGFVLLALVGAGLLSLPLARANGVAEWTFSDAFFTSTSAVCVTGLSVRDVGSELSLRGQVILLGLIQVGGLGLVTLACGTGVLERGRLGVRELNVVAETLGIAAPGRIRRFLAFVLGFTFVAEALGAALLWFGTRDVDLGGHDRAWWCTFHAVSAFCNAGFGLSPASLMPWSQEPFIVLTIAGLIVLGGLGFGVHMDVFAQRPLSFDTWRWLRWRLSESIWWPFRHRVFETPVRPRLSLNSRLVLATTGILLAAGALTFLGAESRHALAGLPPGERWVASIFQSVTARTAGFNSVDIASLQPPTLLLLILLMLVGASPLSTGGGIRTTTVAVALLAVRAMTRGREYVEAFGRTIALPVVHACIAIAVMYAAALVVVTAALLATQPGVALTDAFFESVSALSTVGLSTGLTAKLDTTGRWILCAAMIGGRVGPLAVLWMFVVRPRPIRYRYPEEPVVIA